MSSRKTWGYRCDIGPCHNPATIHVWEEQAAGMGWTHVCAEHRGKRVETARDREMWKHSAYRKRLGI